MRLAHSGILLPVVLTFTLCWAGMASAELPEPFVEDFTSWQNMEPEANLAVVDTVAGTARPIPIETWTVTETTTHEVYDLAVNGIDLGLDGGNIYLAEGIWGLEMVRREDHVVVGSLREAGDLVLGVVLWGPRAFLANGYNGVKVVLIENGVLLSLGSYDTPGYASDVVVAGDRAFVADGNSGIVVLDITTSIPTLVGAFDTPGSAKKLALHGDLLYVADGTGGLQILDVSSPALPVQVGSVATSSMTNDVTVAGQFAFLADNATGLVALDITDPAAPVVTDIYDTPGLALAVELDGNRAYVADDTAGMQILDITDPYSLRLIDTYDSGERVRCVAPYTDGGYVGCASGLKRYHRSGPVSAEMELGSYHSGSWSSLDATMVVDGNLLFYGAGYFTILDIADPAHITLLGQVDTPGIVQDVAVAGKHAYLADGSGGLTTLDIQDPAAATIASSLPLPDGDATSIAITGNVAFVATPDSLYTIDITSATLPAIIGATGISGIVALDVSSNLLYAAHGTEVAVFDITDPMAALSPLWLFNGSQSIVDMAVQDDQVFLAEGTGGVEQWRYLPASGPYRIGSLSGITDAEGLCLSSQFLGVRQPDDQVIVYTLEYGPASFYRSFLPDVVGSYKDIAFRGRDVLVGHRYGIKVHPIVQDDIEISEVFGSYFNSTSDPIVRVRQSMVTTDSVQVHIMRGLSQFDTLASITQEGLWTRLYEPCLDPTYRAKFVWDRHGYDAVLSNLRLEFLTPRPYVDTVTDIPGDQGQQVRLKWQRSGFDFQGEAEPITQYAIYRRYTAKSTSQVDLTDLTDPIAKTDALSKAAAGWEFVATVPVRNEDTYAMVVPTLADSTIASGQAWSAFMVTALTATPGVFYDSPPDSGYSVDNLAPAVPAGFKTTYAAAGNELSWLESQDADFQYFNIYRGTTTDFVPSEENHVQTLIGTSWTDDGAGPGFFYKLTAVDFAGNESDAAVTETASGVDQPGLPTRFALLGNVPNPFNPSTTIAFTVPEGAGRVRVAVYDVRGRVVARLFDGVLSPGVEEIVWNGQNLDGSHAPSGMYFVRLVSGTTQLTQKISLIK